MNIGELIDKIHEMFKLHYETLMLASLLLTFAIQIIPVSSESPTTIKKYMNIGMSIMIIPMVILGLVRYMNLSEYVSYMMVFVMLITLLVTLVALRSSVLKPVQRHKFGKLPDDETAKNEELERRRNFDHDAPFIPRRYYPGGVSFAIFAPPAVILAILLTLLSNVVHISTITLVIGIFFFGFTIYISIPKF